MLLKFQLGVHVFLPSLIRFLLKRKVNSIPTLLLTYRKAVLTFQGNKRVAAARAEAPWNIGPALSPFSAISLIWLFFFSCCL